MNLAPHPFSLRQLQYIVAVADELSFRRAAERCRVSQPSLSAQLAQVEEVLSIRLFERDRKRVILTPAGSSFVDRARTLLRDADDLIDLARRGRDPLLGTLRLGVIPTISPYLLPFVTPELRRVFENLSTIWIEDKTDVLASGLRSGALDAALLAMEADVGEIEFETIAKDPFVLAVPPHHKLARRKGPASLSDLRGEDVLLLDDGHCFREQALAVCSSADAKELEFRATSLPTLAHMVAGGLGVTLLPALAIATEARHANLALRSFKNPPPHRTLALVWRKRSALDSSLRRIARTIREVYPKRAKHEPFA